MMAASNMNTMATASIAGESKNPKLASCEEKPPRPMMEKVWVNESKNGIPTAHKLKVQAIVINR